MPPAFVIVGSRPEHERYLRGLGVALVSVWDRLPEPVRQQVIGEAVLALHEEPRSQLQTDLEAFIQAYAGAEPYAAPE